MHGKLLSVCVMACMCALTSQQQTIMTEFKGYKNAWLVKVQDVNTQDYTRIVHVCKHDCVNVASSDTQNVDCMQMKQLINSSHWFHHQIDLWSQNDWVDFCDAVASQQDTSWTQTVNVVIESGMHILQPFSVEIKNNPSVLAPFVGGEQWLQEWTDNDLASLRLTLRITHIFAHDKTFAVFFSMLVIEVPKPRQQLITTAVQSKCRQLGYSAPQYAHLFLRYLHGETQCVWECLIDTLRQPFNAPPPVSGETSNKTCARVPAEFMAVVFGFTLETAVHFGSALDLGEEFFNSLDGMAMAITSAVTAETKSMVLTALQIPGSMQSVGSFMDRLESMQAYRGAQYSWQYSTNHNFAHAATMRRLLGSHVSDLHVQGVVVTAVNASVHDVWHAIQTSVISQTASLPASLRVVGVLDVDLGLAVTVNKKLLQKADDFEAGLDSRAELWKNLLPLLVAASVGVSMALVLICRQYASTRPQNAHLQQNLLCEPS